MNKTLEGFTLRLLIPILVGIILYAQVYILHFFDNMDFNLFGVIVLIIPVIFIFEIDRLVNGYYNQRVKQKTFKSIITIFLTSLIISLLFVFACYIPRKLYEINHFSNDTIGWFHIISVSTWVFFIVIFANAFNQIRHLFEQWQEEALRSERLEKEKVLANLANLKSQISPHFLFNNLNTLYGLIDEKSKDARAYLQHLSLLYRQILNTRNEEAIPLQEELGFLENYLYLIKIRFANSILVNIDVKGALSSWMIPPLTLQMLVENAIKHCDFNEQHPLQIEIKNFGESLLIKNSIWKTNKEVDSTGVGLVNIQNRYAFLSSSKVEWKQTDDDFQVTLPLVSLTQAVI
ncbi:MAG: histidine kinase [Bacteroidota bacterium]